MARVTQGDDPTALLLAEQLAYYRARAPEYSKTAIPEFPVGDLATARDAVVATLDAFAPRGEVLELACGPATWTRELLRHATMVTAVDGAPEMLALAARRVGDARVRWVQADIFAWEPDQRYDVVFFGFWLSHVPMERFDAFWALVGRCLKPGGRVAFVDDAYRTADELVNGDASAIIRRRLTHGRAFQAVKVPHSPDRLEHRLRELGWAIDVRYVARPFFWGAGAARPART
jgi:demethylmenaquinone methyltransferase/2-methoxy-6-polyprenyl-1,4-benzoquinol methylase